MASTAAAKLPLGTRVGNSGYMLKQGIGGGSFGYLYVATAVNEGYDVAVKVEPLKVPFPQLLYESRILHELQTPAVASCGASSAMGTAEATTVGVPRLLFRSQEAATDGQVYNFVGMELLGFNLERLFEFCRRRFSLKTVLMLSVQMLQRLEHVHRHGYVHRDVKPDNFVFGLGDSAETLYLIDFGLSKQLMGADGKHIGIRSGKHLTGTPRYASLNNHEGIEQSRRDDVESLVYVLIYFLNGKLPWQSDKQGGGGGKAEQYKEVGERKKSTPASVLCKGLPACFLNILSYARSLQFEQLPDYAYLHAQLQKTAREHSLSLDDALYDWSRMRIHRPY
jgi:serine/threonine protein kinase